MNKRTLFWIKSLALGMILAGTITLLAADTTNCTADENTKCLSEVDHLKLENAALSVTNAQMQIQILQTQFDKVRLQGEQSVASYNAQLQTLGDALKIDPKEWQLNSERSAFVKIQQK